jgi:hypothetical protein
MGMIMFFLNGYSIVNNWISLFSLVVHVIYMLYILKLDPYEKTIRLHRYSLLLSLLIVLIGLSFVNYLNFYGSLSVDNSDLFGYFMIGSCMILNVLTGIRLYY